MRLTPATLIVLTTSCYALSIGIAQPQIADNPTATATVGQPTECPPPPPLEPPTAPLPSPSATSSTLPNQFAPRLNADISPLSPCTSLSPPLEPPPLPTPSILGNSGTASGNGTSSTVGGSGNSGTTSGNGPSGTGGGSGNAIPSSAKQLIIPLVTILGAVGLGMLLRA
ncbi:hypothetical protein B0H16DRAFT_1544597 [Mycena metata]|uniref:Uncharacterized protein n=1 Tax=Mycena metata TaxID=1033252 RepID=A0AAD7J3A4_9AGAR|nr:hypothetical protein B0H16DRAFT_1612574 [Mycena metata]KAJ7753568.1 hypothetical protein B0H16DRAFT_1544597 [Mycena metata]